MHELATLALWLIAAAGTWYIQGDTADWTYLAPLYFICMLGSVLIVRQARRRG